MDRKVNIINRLKRMGYSVGEDSGIYSIALRTTEGYVYVVMKTELDFNFRGDLVAEIVREINELIVSHKRGGERMSQGISHEEYLKRQLSSNKMKLENLHVENRMRIVEYDTKKQSLQSQIDSIEQQLDSHK